MHNFETQLFTSFLPLQFFKVTLRSSVRFQFDYSRFNPHYVAVCTILINERCCRLYLNQEIMCDVIEHPGMAKQLKTELGQGQMGLLR